MSSKFFVLYGDPSITAYVSEYADLLKLARRENPTFDPEKYSTCTEALAVADRILQTRYMVFGLFDYTPEGMAEFLELAAAQADDLVGLHALEIAQDYIEDAQRALAVAFTEAQQRAMDRVQFPMAGDKAGFAKYQERISDIRDLSIKALYEYVENGDEIP
jgi:hypothetical protein